MRRGTTRSSRPRWSRVSYFVPAGVHRAKESIRKSRFITTLDRASDRPRATEVVERTRAEFPDATHHCWAFVAGPPGDSGQVGMSDDGEPHGTAGRPMLTALLNGGVGEVVAVVTRYYGGVKLGKGGLSRAYSGGVVAALQSLPTELLVPRIDRTVAIEHGYVTGARRIFEQLGVEVSAEEWGQSIRYDLSVPAAVEAVLAAELARLTRGVARLEPGA